MTKRKLMTEDLKEEIAKELGVYEQVKKDGGWQNVSSKDCGNIVTKAIEIAMQNNKYEVKGKSPLTSYLYNVAKNNFLAYNIKKL